MWSSTSSLRQLERAHLIRTQATMQSEIRTVCRQIDYSIAVDIRLVLWIVIVSTLCIHQELHQMSMHVILSSMFMDLACRVWYSLMLKKAPTRFALASTWWQYTPCGHYNLTGLIIGLPRARSLINGGRESLAVCHTPARKADIEASDAAGQVHALLQGRIHDCIALTTLIICIFKGHSVTTNDFIHHPISANPSSPLAA